MENVVSLKTAKKLKAAGFPQDTYMIWWNRPNHKPAHLLEPAWYVRQSVGSRGKYYAAPGAQDIANELPRGLGITHYPDDAGKWCARRGEFTVSNADSLVEALALLWLELHKS